MGGMHLMYRDEFLQADDPPYARAYLHLHTCMYVQAGRIGLPQMFPEV